jgi:hypothetical protein
LDKIFFNFIAWTGACWIECVASGKAELKEKGFIGKKKLMPDKGNEI